MTYVEFSEFKSDKDYKVKRSIKESINGIRHMGARPSRAEVHYDSELISYE